MAVKKIADGVHFGSAIVSTELSDKTPYVKDLQEVKQIQLNGKDTKIIQWGKNNNLPSQRELAATDNNIASQLLKKQRDFVLGGGLALFEEVAENDRIISVERVNINPVLQQQLDDMQIEDVYLQDAASDVVLHSNVFVEFREKNDDTVLDLTVRKCRNVRLEAETDGFQRIKKAHLAANWGTAAKSTVLPFWNKELKSRKYIRRFGDRMFGGPYYYAPAWWASKHWLKLANVIPLFHLANLENGYFPKYHIKIPNGYFLPAGFDLDTAHEDWTDEMQKQYDDAEAKKLAFIEKLDGVLAGMTNVGRTVYTTYDADQYIENVKKSHQGIEITPIPGNLQDEALLSLFDKSNDAIISGNGILPSLSGIQTGGTLSSGSDIKNALTYYLATHLLQPRKAVYKPLNIMLNKNRNIMLLPKTRNRLFFGSTDILLSTTDKEPTGMKIENNLPT